MGDGRGTQSHHGRAAPTTCSRVRPAPLRHERRHPPVTLAALALDNERLKTELEARLVDVQASRARIVEVGDRERRRVERNLHDGAQQRLVALALSLRLASTTAEDESTLAALVDGAAAELDAAIDELRTLARGLHPAIVTEAGLAGALETLAERPGIPVELYVDLTRAVPETVEVGAYYFVAEALANVNRHADAARVTVRALVVAGSLRVTVCDDGRGGAAVAAGSGLEGLTDRIGALGGQLAVDSRSGCGTTLTADIPLA